MRRPLAAAALLLILATLAALPAAGQNRTRAPQDDARAQNPREYRGAQNPREYRGAQNPREYRGAQNPREYRGAWEQAETEHFLFIFEHRDRASADELLTFCEEVYQKVTGFFGSRPAKVVCVLRGRVDEANGFTMSFPSKIELYLSAPTDHGIGARTESWLKLLLTHELTHFVHQSMDRGLFHNLSLFMGQDIAALSQLFLPGWMIEGPSTNLETLFTSGGRGRNPFFELYIKAPVAEGKLFTLEQAGYPSAFPPPGRIYVAGYFLVDYLLEIYGRETFVRIMDEYLDFPFCGPWKAIEKVTGENAAAIFEAVEKRLAEKYRHVPPSRGRAVFADESIADYENPRATEKGIYLYRSSPDRFPSLVRLDRSDGKEEVLLKVRLSDSRSFSSTADGEEVYLCTLFSDTRKPSEEKAVSDLCALDVGSRRGISADSFGVVRRITRGAHLWQPAVSTDGRHLVAVQGAGPYTRLVSVDPSSGEMSVLFSRADANVYTPVFSPDGRRLAFTFNQRDFQDVWVADFDALLASSQPLTDAEARIEEVNAGIARPVLGPDLFGEYFPSFLDSDHLLFCSDRHRSLSLYIADLASGEVSLVLSDPIAAVSGIRDGNSLIFSTYSSAGWRLKTIPLAALDPMPLEPESELIPYPPATTWTGREVRSRPYADLPSSFTWLPNLVLSRTGPKSLDREIGAGALVLGSSFLGDTSWSADFAWSPVSSQPQCGASFSTSFGRLRLDTQSRLSYGYWGGFSESLSSSLSFTFPLIAETSLDTAQSLSLWVGLRHGAFLSSPRPFAFDQALQAPPGSWGNFLETVEGVRYSWQALGGRLDFNPPLAVEAVLQNRTAPPVLSAHEPAGAFSLLFSLNIPSPIAHHVIKVGAKTSFLLGGLYGHSVVAPRGFMDFAAPDAPCATLASIDYLAPIALLDQPLPFGWALTAAGLGLHVEGIGGWGLSPTLLELLDTIYAGGDLTIRLACGSAISLPLGFGVAARVSARNPTSFDPKRDLDVYFFLGFDSFSALACSNRW